MGYRSAKGTRRITRNQVYETLYCERSRRAREAAGPASDGRDFDDRGDIRIRRRIALPSLGRENHISVGCDDGYGADAAASKEIDLFLVSRGISTEMGRVSRRGPVYEQHGELDVGRFCLM